MIGIAITLILALTGLLAVKLVLIEVAEWRLNAFSWAAKDYSGLAKALARLANVTSNRYEPPEAEASDPMPDDIIRITEAYPDQWAREGLEKHAKELYKVYRDWSKVSQQLLQEEIVGE